MAREFLQMSKDVVSVVCLKFLMQDPEGDREKEQTEESAQAVGESCVHQIPTTNLKCLVSNLHFLLRGSLQSFSWLRCYLSDQGVVQ